MNHYNLKSCLWLCRARDPRDDGHFVDQHGITTRMEECIERYVVQFFTKRASIQVSKHPNQQSYLDSISEHTRSLHLRLKTTVSCQFQSLTWDLEIVPSLTILMIISKSITFIFDDKFGSRNFVTNLESGSSGSASGDAVVRDCDLPNLSLVELTTFEWNNQSECHYREHAHTIDTSFSIIL